MNDHSPSLTPETTALVRRIQKALLDGHTLSIQDHRYTWVPAGATLPELDANDPHLYQARFAGVFQEATIVRAGEERKGWLHWAHLDDLDERFGPLIQGLSASDRDALSVGLSFQVVMHQEQQDRAARRSPRPK